MKAKGKTQRASLRVLKIYIARELLDTLVELILPKQLVHLDSFIPGSRCLRNQLFCECRLCR
ncbi:MAG: hypothetical protein AVDCRST_MAG93-5640, partial [uncultured Chloroflexia bacterium]